MVIFKKKWVNNNYVFFQFKNLFTTAISLLGYVDEIKDVVLGNTEEELQITLDKYKKKVTKPLTSQFPERKTKAEAVNALKKRKSNGNSNAPTM